MQRYRSTPAILGAVAALVVVAALAAATLWRTPSGAAQGEQPILEYPDYPPTPTVGPNPTAAPSLAAAPVFSADFAAAAALDQVELVDLENVLDDHRANWLIDNGRLRQDAAGLARNPSTHEIAVLAKDGSYADATVRASFYDEFNGVAGLIARFSGDPAYEASFYRYRVIKDEYEATPKHVLEKVVDGIATPLAELEGPGFTPREWHVLELTVVGGTISASLDGEVVLEATDAQPLPAGSAGVYTRAIGGLFYDDLTVSQP